LKERTLSYLGLFTEGAGAGQKCERHNCRYELADERAIGHYALVEGC